RLDACKHFLNALPADAVLEEVKLDAKGLDAESAARHLKEAQDTLSKWRNAPTLEHVEQEIQNYVAKLRKPTVNWLSGRLDHVGWSQSAMAAVAFLKRNGYTVGRR